MHFSNVQLFPSHYSQESRSCFYQIKSMLDGSGGAASPELDEPVVDIKKNLIMDEEEFFAPQYNYSMIYYSITMISPSWLRPRPIGEVDEKYERPCGWYRFGLKVGMSLLKLTCNFRTSFQFFVKLLYIKYHLNVPAAKEQQYIEIINNITNLLERRILYNSSAAKSLRYVHLLISGCLLQSKGCSVDLFDSILFVWRQITTYRTLSPGTLHCKVGTLKIIEKPNSSFGNCREKKLPH